jgi:hypothetical protein
MGRDITQYWKVETALGEIERGPDLGPAHSAGSMLARAEPGDRLWILTSDRGRLCLVQHFVITKARLSQRQAARLRGVRESDIWESDSHVLGPKGWRLPRHLIDIHAVADQLRFASTRHPVLRLKNGKLDPQALRSLRILTPESGLLLEGLWKCHVTAMPRESAIDTFDPDNVDDARRRVLATIAVRQGQVWFRQALLAAYGGRCAITGADAQETLEAAHIVPYRGTRTNNVTNGLLLRADVHTLFDVGLIIIDTRTMSIRIDPKLRKTCYVDLEGLLLRPPRERAQGPSVAALNAHRRWARSRHT